MDEEARQLIDRLIMLIERSRHWRIIGYTLLVSAGMVSFYAPSDVLRSQSSVLIIYLTSGIWIFGSLIALVSSIRDRLFGELFAIPLIGAALIAFSIALFWYGGVSNGRTWAYAMFFASFGSFLADRWFECRALESGRTIIHHRTEDRGTQDG